MRRSDRTAIGCLEFLAANAAAALSFMLAFYAVSVPRGIAETVARCSSCSLSELAAEIASYLWGIITVLILTPFAALIMLPITLLLTPLAFFIIARSPRRRYVVLIGGLVGAVLGWPLLMLVYGLVAPGSGMSAVKNSILSAGLCVVAPSAAAGMSFAWVITRSRSSPGG
ncbi:hypothetical protein SFC76_13075 [Sphingomonas sp. CD22]|uniref:hypothetical protein n=1 Tax=Sphingomonas sp. CD22 TaxID=3100214 RepID=UPI002ADF0AB4|nr:hypothetical protein [Sphingomonas sp. CD22]MEA1085194.1 hypothetical protein [Sphingomonas sp. CD22]